MAMTLIDALKRAQSKAPVDVEGLAMDLGITVNYAYLAPEISGELVQTDSKDYEININAEDPHTRQRFTLAHEIGHFVYHRDLIGDGLDDDRAYRSTATGSYHNKRIGPRQETDANKFAASLLMPQSLIDQLREEGCDRAAMADRLGVSEAAMAIRLGEPYPQ